MTETFKNKLSANPDLGNWGKIKRNISASHINHCADGEEKRKIINCQFISSPN